MFNTHDLNHEEVGRIREKEALHFEKMRHAKRKRRRRNKARRKVKQKERRKG